MVSPILQQKKHTKISSTDHGHSLCNYFFIMDANANKYSLLRKKSTSKFEAKVREKIQETLQ